MRRPENSNSASMPGMAETVAAATTAAPRREELTILTVLRVYVTKEVVANVDEFLYYGNSRKQCRKQVNTR